MSTASARASSEALPEGLVGQLAFYFSESNLRRDRFLLRLTGAEGTGDVPISTLATFNLVAALTTDESIIARALRSIDWLAVSEDGSTVRRASPLPAHDTSLARTVYAENLPAGSTIESLQELFAPHGGVAFVSLPRCASRDALGFAFIEYHQEEHAAAAVAAMDGTPPADGLAPLRVMAKGEWEVQKRVYKESRAGVNKRAAEAARRQREAQEAAEAAAAGIPRRVVCVSRIPRGGNIKALRREIAALFNEVAPVDYVDYGVSNSGNPSVGFVRMKNEVDAAEAARRLTESAQTVGGAAVAFEVMAGAGLAEYTKVIEHLRATSGKVKQRKRAQWWSRKWGSKSADGGEGAAASDGGEAGEGAAESDGGEAAGEGAAASSEGRAVAGGAEAAASEGGEAGVAAGDGRSGRAAEAEAEGGTAAKRQRA